MTKRQQHLGQIWKEEAFLEISGKCVFYFVAGIILQIFDEHVMYIHVSEVNMEMEKIETKISNHDLVSSVETHPSCCMIVGVYALV